jgi:hypothetical protein
MHTLKRSIFSKRIEPEVPDDQVIELDSLKLSRILSGHSRATRERSSFTRQSDIRMAKGKTWLRNDPLDIGDVNSNGYDLSRLLSKIDLLPIVNCPVTHADHVGRFVSVNRESHKTFISSQRRIWHPGA